jgi:hypothetical protein
VSDQETLQMLPLAAAAVDGPADGYLAQLGGFDERDQEQVDRCLQEFLRKLIRSVWERGWAPPDLIHHSRRRLEPGIEPLLLAAIASEHRAYRESTVDPRWLDQLTDFGIDRSYAELNLTSCAAPIRTTQYRNRV